MTVMEKATELGKLIADSEEVVEMKKAKEAYDNDADVQKWIVEYNVQNAALSEEYKKDKKDDELLNSIKTRIGELYNQIIIAPSYTAYIAAQDGVNKLMTKVNDEINFQITGERPDNCTHDCSTCGGCH